MKNVNERNYIVIQGWMIKELGLKGNELLIYAIIYGFSQAEGTKFSGSLQYLADWCNASKKTVQTALKNLIEKNYIEKEEKFINGVKFCYYLWKKFPQGMEDFTMGYGKNYHGGMEDFTMGYGKNYHGGMEDFTTNNINNNINIHEKQENL